MRGRSAAWWRVAVLLGAFGCSSADSGSPFVPGPAQGGQTGALTPACGLSPAADEGAAIPAGDTPIVFYTDSCGPAFDLRELELVDQDGVAVDYDLETLEPGLVLLRPRRMLQRGTYRVQGPDLTARSLAVAEPAPLPMRLGTLQQTGVGCAQDLQLLLDTELIEYLPQLKLSVSVDGSEPWTWFDYGTLHAPGGQAALTLPECSPSCLEDGLHELELTAELAGEPGTLEPIELELRVMCEAPESGSCQAGGRPTGGGLATWITLLLLLGLRRTRAAPS